MASRTALGIASRRAGSIRQLGRRKASTAATTSSSPVSRPRTALFFPGQGVQRVGMVDPWLEAFPRTVQPILDEMDETLQLPLSQIIAKGSNAALSATENAQPAIMATSILILRVLEQEFGFGVADRVDVVLGHSMGEFAALVAGGYLCFRDALVLVRMRAEAMAQCTKEAKRREGGEFGMIALVCENEERMHAMVRGINDFLHLSTVASKVDSALDIPAVQQVSIANINSKNQIVLSGNLERISTLMANLRQFGGHDPRHVQLRSDSPFHSPLMQPAREAIRRMLQAPSPTTGDDIITWPGIVPCVSNVSARPFESRAQLKDLLAMQATETVRWWYSVRYLDQEEKVRRWIGIGPGKVGRNLVGKEVGMKGAVKGGGVWAITSPKEIDEVLRALDDTERANED